MPVTYRYEGDLVWIEISGDYTLEELKASLPGETKKIEYPLNALMLLDVTSAKDFEKSRPEDIEGLANLLGSFAGKFIGRCAVLVSSAGQYETSRMVSIYSRIAGLEAGVFLEAGDALRWLYRSEEGVEGGVERNAD